MKGRINSFQSMGAADGPGIRFVVFVQGCPLRCVYCHNPETWDPSAGEEWETEEIAEKVLRYRSYFGTQGGITISGGEPLLQWEFVAELFRQLKEKGIHTVLDTSGIGSLAGAREVLKYTDLVMCDLKFAGNNEYQRYCGGSMDQVLRFLKLTEEKKIPLRIRHVVVPGLTDSISSVRRIRKRGESFSNYEGLELLPFRKLCLGKYEEMGLPFPLSGCPECPDRVIQELGAMV
ncbi:pyruvate formate lyase-activating protein [Anoxybacterium hadale]|uniref:Pyruvate formate lyase-activating protein n=1 Tax=Anoxybacterium hadale TaxID=3408580 RepID=A0ACD1A776_9FIRM|nr:pyruvate formate lyase-activating protein [Clostridiales bacterium]